MNRRFRKFIDEPNMSDKTLLVSVEDLICTAFGPTVKNTVNFKLVQTILHILARQLRLLEQDVEIKFDDIGIDFASSTVNRDGGRRADDDYYSEDDYDSESYTSSSSEGDEAEGRGKIKERGTTGGKKKQGEKGEKGEKEERGEKGAKKERRREKGEKGEREDKDEKGEKKEKKGKDEKGGKDKRRRSKDKQSESKDRRTNSSPKGRGTEDEGVDRESQGRGKHRRHDEDDIAKGGERDGRSRRQGGQPRRGDDDEDEGGERGGHGRRHGERPRRGDDVEVEGGERDGHGRRHGGRPRRGEDDEEEGGERGGHGRKHGRHRKMGEDDGDEGRRRGGRSREREDRERRGDRHGERRGDQHGERGGDQYGERGGDRHGERRGDQYEERRGDSHGERRGDQYGERRRDRQGESGGAYDDYDDGRRRRVAGREGSGTSITVTEAQRKRETGATDKVLVAERGPATHGRVARVGSIEVVTASQFALLERAVRQLEHVSGPLPAPAMPDNQQLRADLAAGRASLADTMEAVQLNKRVQAAEEGLSRMAGLLTQLTAAGALPSEFAMRIGNMQAELRKATLPGQRSSPFTPGPGSTRFAVEAEHSTEHEGGLQEQALGPGGKPVEGRSAITSAAAAVQPAAAPVRYDDMPVTHNEMQTILEQMKEALTKEIQNLTARANHSADIASNTSRNVSEKLNIILSIDERISTLYSQTADYAEQLNGFDTGLSTQMASFQEQMSVMRADLKGGLEMLESANNNAETAAILDLTERYQTLVIELDNTVHLHTNLSMVAHQIRAELKTLLECVEMLREQKADRDEVQDGLRDKADMSRLAGLLYEKDFAKARFEIEKRIEKSYEKFRTQDQVWQLAMQDLTRITERKAELLALTALKDEAEQQLNAIQSKLRQLETMLGEPQAALLTRRLAAGAACGACAAPAVMPLQDAAHGQPARLPALRPPPRADVCAGDVVLRPVDPRKHICHRWVGGSHTLVAGGVLRERAEHAQLHTQPSRKYEGYGTDGRLYMMEEELQPCAECNKMSSDADPPHLPPPSPTPTGEGGAGDQPPGKRGNET